jgi:hypothetical protein
MGCIFLVLIVGLGFGWFYFWLGLFYQKLVYLSMFFVGFIVINQVIGWFLRVD